MTSRSSASTSKFEFLILEGAHLVLRFDDSDHLTETWTWRQDNKDIPMLFHLTRKKN